MRLSPSRTIVAIWSSSSTTKIRSLIPLIHAGAAIATPVYVMCPPSLFAAGPSALRALGASFVTAQRDALEAPRYTIRDHQDGPAHPAAQRREPPVRGRCDWAVAADRWMTMRSAARRRPDPAQATVAPGPHDDPGCSDSAPRAARRRPRPQLSTRHRCRVR